jgi:quercetin dioxygenase-like cupin family protein
VLLSLLLLTGTALATPSEGVSGVLEARGILPEVVRAKFKAGEDGFTNGTDVADIRVVKYSVLKDGTFGWHQHGGPVWVIVKKGILTIYSGDDPTCTPKIYGEGDAFLDPGDHTHIGKNETSDTVEIYAIFMLPNLGEPRVDVPDPGVCD